MSKKISFEKFHHSQQKQPRPRLTSVNDSFALRERVVDRRSFHPSNVSWPSSSGPKGFAGLFLASWTRGISSIFPLISDKATLDCLSPHSSFSGFAGIIRPINGNSLCLSLSPFPLLFLYLSFRHRSRATRTDPVTLWIAGIHEGNSIFRIVRDEALPHGLATPLLFSSSHFRRICARDTRLIAGANPRGIPETSWTFRLTLWIPLELERGDGNFEVASLERIIYSRIQISKLISPRRKMASIFSRDWIRTTTDYLEISRLSKIRL